jgi:tRNA pseudouridine55 synthase
MTTSNGLLLIDKPRGVTSHDVVARVRKVLQERRVGHAGTLDPMATGLLVLAVGPSTRLLRFAQGETKTYEGVVTFGVATDSLDADGAVTDRREVPALEVDVVNAYAARMLGTQLQTPPMVSAIKVGGQRLHALARQGVEVEREPRSVTISSFSLDATERPDEWSFAVTCSPGTYVRVLLSDLAVALGTLGHLSALRRSASGDHDVADALELDDLAARVLRGEPVLAPPSAFVTRLEAVVVTGDQASRLRQGQRVELEERDGDEIAAMDEAGALVAVLRRRAETWQPVVVLPSEPPSGPSGEPR